MGTGALRVRLLGAEDRPQAERVLSRVTGAPVQLEADPSALSVSVPDARRASDAIGELSREGVELADFSLGQPTLDAVFLALTGHTADGATADGAGDGGRARRGVSA